MPNDWDRPIYAPLRTGDFDPDRIYLAVGRALSSWERLESAVLHLFAALTGSAAGPYMSFPTIRAFGTLTSPATRAQMIEAAGKAMFEYLRRECNAQGREEAEELEKTLAHLLRAYRGWMARRNDIAHGYVNEREHPDYNDQDEKTVKSYSLYPSDGSSAKWCFITGEQAYNFKAEDIDKFAAAFAELKIRVRLLAVRIDEWRKKLRVSRRMTGTRFPFEERSEERR